MLGMLTYLTIIILVVNWAEQAGNLVIGDEA